MYTVKLLLTLVTNVLAAQLRSTSQDPQIPHVTYFALSGGEDAAMTEFTLSAFSLCKIDPSVRILLLTDQQQLAPRAIARLNTECWDGKEPQAYVKMIHPKQLRSRFHEVGFTKFSHHSGLGGYAKVLAAELIPDTIDRTIVVDTDTVFNNNVKNMWNTFNSFPSGQVLAAKPIYETRCFKAGERLNSGVVLMDLNAMRKSNWTQYVLDKTAALRSDTSECASCVKGETLVCGDQDLASFACQQQKGACGHLEPEFHCDHCMDHADGWHKASNIVVYHFNCGAKYYKCPGKTCQHMVTEFIDRVNPFREFAFPIKGRQPWGGSH